MIRWSIFIRCLILGFTWAGSYGVSRELTPADTSLGPNAWIIPFVVLCLIMFILLTDGLETAIRREREQARQQMRQWLGDCPTELDRFKQRMRVIQQIADEHMKQAQYGKRFPVREHVLVPWERLMAIWNLANLAETETPVEE